jgi:hypothetical protein
LRQPRPFRGDTSYTRWPFHASHLSHPPAAPSHRPISCCPSFPPAPPSCSTHSHLASALSDWAPFRRDIFPLRSREQRSRQAPPSAAARNHSSLRIPEPLVEPVWTSSRFMRAPAARTAVAATNRQPHGSASTTPSSAETTGTKNVRRRVLATKIANALRSNRRAHMIQPEQHLQAPGHRGEVLSLASPVPVPVVVVRHLRRREANREPSSESTNSPAAAVYWSAPAAATVTMALPPALHDSDAHRSIFAAHLRAVIDAKTSRRGMPHSRPSGGTNVVGLKLRRLRRRSAVGCLSQRPASVRTFDVTIACLKEARHDHIQVATAR